MPDRPVSPMEKAAEAFALKEAELMGWRMSEARQRFGLWREELAAAVLAFLEAAAEDRGSIEAMVEAMRPLADQNRDHSGVSVALLALAARQREENDG